MTTNNKLYTILGLLVLAGMLAAGFVFYRQHAQLSTTNSTPLPTSTEWASAISTSTAHILAGNITALKSGSLTLLVEMPPGVGTTSLLVGSSTPITKHTPKSAAELAAAFKEFQQLQKEAKGKPFAAPSASTVTNLSFSELKVGDSVIITLTPDSTEGHFAAQSIEVTLDAAPTAGVH